MATPTRPPAVSTPKSQFTPNRVNASPRPGTSGNANRNLAYKSPAVKTPASIPGHTHHVSVSSQPSSTPLAAHTIHDDLLALNSPAAALIASMGSTGMTPLTNGADGLGITGNGQGAATRVSAVSANPEMERIQRIQLVASTLKTRVAGRGLTREGVERLAQVHGFSTLLDEGNLSIAGKATVDLEVVFDTIDRDLIREVNLKLIKNDAPEAQFQERGTQVLKDNLQPFTTVDGTAQWTDLRDYESNLDYLHQLDCIQGGIDAIDSLYDAFQKIWNAERDRLKSANARQRLRHSALGRPFMDRTPKLGLAIDYWNRRPDSQPSSEDDDSFPDHSVYSANISCEQGKPYTLPLNGWVSESVLTEAPQGENHSENAKVGPDWQASADEAEYLSLVEKADAMDPTGDEKTDAPPSILKMHFISKLVPEVYLPLNIAESIVELGMFEMNQEMTVTYQKALQDHFNTTKARGSQSTSEERWPRCLPITSEGGPLKYRRHSYALHSVQPGAVLWCYPVTRLKFIHPRQLAGAIPILRQYALVWSLLRSLVEYGDAEPNTMATAADHSTQNVVAARPSRTSRRSNVKATKNRLDDLLGIGSPEGRDDVVPVDVSLDTVSDSPKAKLDIYVPLFGSLAGGRQSPFIFISLHVCPDGIIEVKNLNGAQVSDKSEELKLREQVSRIVTATEDIGLLVEWVLLRAGGSR
ncbi:hypothetical protein PV08_10718 [Exophiala spinifera]|uniref:Mediator of RNA polymerase II transcription subunit 1 n=1 Tax=Exophiala spinifera TaxID=91928 RepID=A0A0D2AXI3_9EURO|nr:uncharacterized protein PV08_10718 [Exophiala spinifera]KIW11418.1 hypothetical protein PV08_10718 [Exophiala spinifera]